MSSSPAQQPPVQHKDGRIDAYAMFWSSLCIVHCLVLPALVVFLPAAALLADAEWVHVLFVILAAPATLWVVSRAVASGAAPLTVVGGLVGLGLLAYAAFIETEYETALSTAGAVLLLAVHGRRLLHRRGQQTQPAPS